MPLLYFESFEMGVNNTTFVPSSYVVGSTQAGENSFFDGSKGCYVSRNDAGAKIYLCSGSTTEIYFGGWIRRYSAQSIRNFWVLHDTNTHVFWGAEVSTNPIGNVDVFGTTNTILATGTVSVPNDASTWYHLEVYYKYDPTVGRVITKINGQTSIDFTGDTTGAGGGSYIDSVGLGGKPLAVGSGYFADTLYDNVFVADEWMGMLRCDTYVPTGDTENNWTRSSGATGTSYTLVDEPVANDATDYVYTTGSAVQEEWNHAGSFDGTAKNIKSVRVYVRSKSTSGTEKINIGIDSNGTESTVTSANGNVAETSWRNHVIGLFNTDPDTGSAWTESGVNNAKPYIESDLT